MDERLRLIVEMQNKASAELRKLSKDFDGVKPTAGMKNTATWFQTLEGASTGATKALRPLAGGLGTIGVSGLAAGLSVAGLIGQFRDLAKAMPALQELSRQTGISKTELERLKATAANLNIDPSKMTAAIGAFSGEMVQFSKQSGEVYAEMQNGASGLARKIAGEWKEHPEQALKDYLGWLAEIPEASKRAGKSAQEGVQIQRYWAQKGLGDADMAQIVGKGMAGFQEAYGQAARDVHEITDETVAAAEKFDRSIASFERTWKDFETTVGPTVFDNLRHATDDFREVFDELKGAMAWYDRFKDHPIQAAAEAAGGFIDDQAKHNKEHPEGILLDVPGLVSKGIHFFTDRGPTGPRPLAPVPTALRPLPFHPDDDRLSRARASDAPDRSLDGFVTGALDKPVTHLVGTLKTAAASIDGNVRPAAFHPAGGPGLTAAIDPEATIAAGTRRGFVEAFRELQGMADLDGKGTGGGSGFTPAAFHMGGVPGGSSASAAGRAPSLRYGRPHSSAPYDDGGATPTGAHDPLKDLIAQHETGGTGAAGYDTAYGHAERGGPLAPPKPLTQMTIAEVLAYQRAMKPRAGSPAFPVGRAQWTESTLRGLTRGMDPSTVFSPDVQEKLFDRSIAGRMGQGPGGFRSEWDSLRAVSDGEIEGALDGHRQALMSAPAKLADAVKAGPDGIPGHVRGSLKIGDETYAYGSGGVRGSAHLPYGDYPIRPDSGNPWGQAHNAMDVNGNGSIWDASLGRMRTGIEMHVAHSANMVTEGCLSFLKEQYPQLKSRVKEMVAKTGHAYLHVNENGASITPFASAPDGPQTKIAPMPAVAPEPRRQQSDDGQRAQIDPVRIDLHHHESGRTKIAAKTGRGVQLSIRTAPTLVQTA